MELIEGRFSDARTTPLLRLRGPMTQRFVRRVAGTAAKIYDTRKTIPGHRLLDKYSVLCGGGMNHRMGLFDGLLVKDNHIAAVPLRELSAFLSQTIARSRAEDANRFIEVEVDTIDQLREVLKVDNVHVILLDNMDCPKMEQAVELRNAAGKKGITDLEASGGVTLETVRQIASTGIERVAVGALTHSATALDVGLDVEDE
jgi:nicotinate-nucleotide pyrophosphorylase (carboxylating)